MQCAVLLAGFEWSAKAKGFAIGDGIRLSLIDGSVLEKLLGRMQESGQLDDGETAESYQVFLTIPDKQLDEGFPDFNAHSSIVAVMVSILAICFRTAPTPCRVVTSKDRFKSSWVSIPNVYDWSDDRELLSTDPASVEISSKGEIRTHGPRRPCIDDRTGERLSEIWKGFSSLCNAESGHRVLNAFNYFFYAWRSHSLEHACINSAIVLETLFSPTDNAELSHRVSFNVAQYVGADRQSKQEIYRLIKKFYGLRSKIVHGARAEFVDLVRVVPAVFLLVADILNKILVDQREIRIFSSTKELNERFAEWLF